MRIGRADFEIGSLGRVHQAVLDAIPEEEALKRRSSGPPMAGWRRTTSRPLSRWWRTYRPQ